jgi:uncharacterized RDD family membrane protein YckC
VNAPTGGSTAQTKGTPLADAGLGLRFAAMVYEGVILFGVVMISGLIYSPLAQQTNALHDRHGLQAFVFLVLAAYFIGFWTYGGQTIAAKTWRLRVVTRAGAALGIWRACARFLLAWLWFVPALVLAGLMGWHSGAQLYGALATGMVVYAVVGVCLPGRQFLHDQLCSTRIAITAPDAKP